MNRTLLLAGLGVASYYAYRALKPRYDFRNKHVLITGGSRGLGLVMARQLAQAGARLSICSRDANELGRAVNDLRALDARVLAVECDVTDRDRVREFIAVARVRNGPVDVLINNAGVIQVGPFEEMREEDFAESLRVHFWAAFYTTLEVLSEMKTRRCGRIVNIASLGGKVAVPHLLPYSVGKFALVGFSNGLNSELQQHGITVTTVCPGLMQTGSHLNAEFKGRHREEYAWFAGGNAVPGVSMCAERAAAKILSACALGDAEVILGLPTKIAVSFQTLFPNLMADLLAFADTFLPKPGGVGSAKVKGKYSRGKLPNSVTAHLDHAAARNNEIAGAEAPQLPNAQYSSS